MCCAHCSCCAAPGRCRRRRAKNTNNRALLETPNTHPPRLSAQGHAARAPHTRPRVRRRVVLDDEDRALAAAGSTALLHPPLLHALVPHFFLLISLSDACRAASRKCSRARATATAPRCLPACRRVVADTQRALQHARYFRSAAFFSRHSPLLSARLTWLSQTYPRTHNHDDLRVRV